MKFTYTEKKIPVQDSEPDLLNLQILIQML